jgi:uncharacterized spore protein YtfJ
MADTSDNTSTLAAVVRDIAHAIEAEGNTKAIFGAPAKLDQHTIIPVATLEIGLGGGGGGGGSFGSEKLREAAAGLVSKLVPTAIAGGGGFGVKLRPVGFLSELEGRVIFTPIEVPPEKGG